MLNRKIFHLFLVITTLLTLETNMVKILAGEGKEIGKVTFLIGAAGDVQIQHKKSDNWQNVKLYSSILNEDKIKTASESRCEVTLEDKSIIRIGENTVFCFLEASIDEYKKNVKSELQKGKIWLNINKLKNNNDDFQIKTPTAVCAVRGTIYRIDTDSLTKSLVYDGKVNVGPVQNWGQTLQQKTNSLQPVEVPGPYEVPPPYEVSLEDWVEIVKGFQIIVRPDGKYAKSRFDPQSDDALNWVKWNKERDSQTK